MKTFVLLASALLATSSLSAVVSPQSAADELLAADRAFAASAAKIDVVTALSAMFASEVVLTHSGGIAYGSAKTVDALRANPINAGRIEWIPVRVGVSGDGQHGFTAGTMTLHRPDGATTPMKYLAYWAKQKDGWRVLAYKRGIAKMPAPATQVSFVLPTQLTAGATDAATIERYRDSLAEAERAFSRDAQTMGIGPAFKHYGHPEAINLGGPDVPVFVIRNDQIAGAVGGNAPANTSPVNWGSEQAIVAASGDFGVNIGYIVQNKPGADPSTGSGQGGKIPPGQPFFTIWKRDSPKERWLYIAE